MSDKHPDDSFTERRHQPERRQDCTAHDQRINEIEGQLEKQNGFMRASSLVVGVATIMLIPIISWYLSGVNSKLDSISSLLNSSSTMIQLHTEQIKNLQNDVREIQDRHKQIDAMRR